MADTEGQPLQETTSQAIVDQPPPAPEEAEPTQTGAPSPSLTPAQEAQQRDEEEAKQFLVGKWHHYDNYGCPHCPYLTIAGAEDIMWHIRHAHPEVGS